MHIHGFMCKVITSLASPVWNTACCTIASALSQLMAFSGSNVATRPDQIHFLLLGQNFAA